MCGGLAVGGQVQVQLRRTRAFYLFEVGLLLPYMVTVPAASLRLTCVPRLDLDFCCLCTSPELAHKKTLIVPRGPIHAWPIVVQQRSFNCGLPIVPGLLVSHAGVCLGPSTD